eukprot:scaffold67812_cov18-Tisochrysis_lutea.AAC.2
MKHASYRGHCNCQVALVLACLSFKRCRFSMKSYECQSIVLVCQTDGVNPLSSHNVANQLQCVGWKGHRGSKRVCSCPDTHDSHGCWCHSNAATLLVLAFIFQALMRWSPTLASRYCASVSLLTVTLSKGKPCIDKNFGFPPASFHVPCS